MDSTYRPASPDLSGSAPSAGVNPYDNFIGHEDQHSQQLPGNGFGYLPTSDPHQHPQQYQPPLHPQQGIMPHVKSENEDEYMPDAQPATKRQRRTKKEPDAMNGSVDAQIPSFRTEGGGGGDPTLGCQLKTSFPVARIKRIMQADEDIGKVAQVTPTVVSRALELFMIKLISAAAHEARGPPGGVSSGKGPKRVLAQHLKRAVYADDKLDFLQEIVGKVPDAPSKAKKEAGSDSEEAPAKPKRRSKKRKDSGDDI